MKFNADIHELQKRNLYNLQFLDFNSSAALRLTLLAFVVKYLIGMTFTYIHVSFKKVFITL